MKKRKCLYAIVCALALLLSACAVENPAETSVPASAETTAPVATPPRIPDGAYPEGEYTVGRSLPPGEYVFIPYTTAQAASAHIKRNGKSAYFCETAGQIFGTVQRGDRLITKHCYFFPAEGYTATPNAEGIYGPGMYRVGIDIPPGEYQITHSSPKGYGEWDYLTTSSVSQAFVNASPLNVVKETPAIVDLSTSYAFSLTLGADTYAVPAPPPENATFLFPEAPEVTKVKALPGSYDAAELVPSYWEQSVAFKDANSFYISIPEIYPFSKEAITAQQEIYQLFYDELHWLVRHSVKYPVTKALDTSEVSIFSDFGSAPIECYGYSAGIRDGILSVTVRNDLHGSIGRSYYVYNFDLATGKRLDSESVTDRLGVSQDAITQGITEYYAEMYAGLPDETAEFYQQNLKKTLSEENLSAGQVCIGEDGSVIMAVEIYSDGSFEHVQRLVKITV